MTLFEECILALDGQVLIMNNEQTKVLFEKLITKFPMTQWGRIDWNQVSNKLVEIKEYDILTKLSEIGFEVSKEVYILWDNAELPAIKSNLLKVLDVLDDVAAVSFDTWIFCPGNQFVIELYHDDAGVVSIGWIEKG